MASHRKILFWAALALLLLLTAPLRNPLSMVDTIAGASTDDTTFRSTLDPHLRSLVDQIRRGPSPYSFEMADHTADPFLYDLALPRLLGTGGARYFTYGPQPLPDSDDGHGKLYERWARMAFTALCWFGAGWMLMPSSIAFALLAGALVTGWAMEALCAVTGWPAAALFDFWAPAALLSALAGVLMRLRRRPCARPSFSVKGLALAAFALFLAWPTLEPYLSRPLSAWDGRVMWGYHFKFQFFEGFRPDRILAHMHRVAERDYPWFLGGAVGLASWRDRAHFAGWHENAVYGALLIPVVALFSLVWRRLGRGAGLALLALVAAPFAPLLSNGYMEALWMPAFALAYAGALYYEELSPLGPRFTLPGTAPFSRAELFALACFAASVKNEGLACIGAALLWRLVRYRRPHWRSVAAAAATLLPALLHKAYVSAGGITDQYRLGERILHYPPYDALKRFESLHRYLVKDLFLKQPAYLAPLLLFLLLPSKHRRPMLAATYAFLAPVLLVYVYTPHDQQWQLETSAARVFLVLPMLFSVLAAAQVKHAAQQVDHDLEGHEGRKQVGPAL